jgi:hypothetical protein
MSASLLGDYLKREDTYYSRRRMLNAEKWVTSNPNCCAMASST